MVAGRKTKVDREDLIKEIVDRKEEIVKDNKIVTKYHKIWNELSEHVNKQLSAASIHAMVTGNRYDLRKKLLNETFDEINDSYDSRKEDSIDISANDSHYFESDKEIEFSIKIEKNVFDEITEKSMRKRNKPGRRPTYEEKLIFVPDVWQKFFSRKIWDELHIRCAFHYRDHSLSKEGTSGTFKAYCKCGSDLRCTLSRESKDKDVVANLVLQPGSGKNCGKNWLRGNIREAVVEDVQAIGVEMYRSKIATELMNQGDSNPPMLYSANVLHAAQSRQIAKQRIHEDPITALDILSHTKHVHAIHDIGRKPFFVHYWTNEQIQTYKKICRMYGATLCIDATGFSIQKIDRPYSNSKKSIFLYLIVAHTSEGQFSLAQMLSERHTTRDIMAFLNDWLSNSVLLPKEIICDESRALLNACVKVFSDLPNVEEYADAFHTNIQRILVRIRIDVAHFMKKYSKLLGGLPRTIKVFYLASIGQLILCEDLEDAKKILNSIFIISNCEFNTNECSIQYNMLEELITEEPRNLIDNIEEQYEEMEKIPNEEIQLSNKNKINYWGKLALDIYEKSEKYFDEKENRPTANAFFLHNIDLKKQILKDMELYPIWSCAFSSHFSFGRNPASSAPVESEMNKFKHIIMKDIQKCVRVDKLLDKHLDYLKGKFNIISADINKHAKEILKRDVCCVCDNQVSNEEQRRCTVCQKSVHVDCAVNYDNGFICLKCLNRKDIIDSTFSNDGLSFSADFLHTVYVNNNEDNPNESPIHYASEKNVSNNDLEDSEQFPVCSVCNSEIVENRILSCSVCRKNVHSIDCISLGCDNEIVCSNCHIEDENIVLNDIENWGGKGGFEKRTRPVGTNKKKNRKRKIEEVRHDIYYTSTLQELQNNNEKNCPACLRGDEPSDAHKCRYCNRNVHVFPECSSETTGDKSEEGYGQRRICRDCLQKNYKGCNNITDQKFFEKEVNLQLDKNASVDLNSSKSNQTEIEKQIPIKKKAAKYLGGNKPYIKDCLIFGNNNKIEIPIIRNGCDITLAPSITNGKNMTLASTCAFDTLLYMTLIAALDFPNIFDKIKATNLQYCELIVDIIQNGIRATTYNKRAAILQEICILYPSVLTVKNNVLNCNVAVPWLARKIFLPFPSFIETSTCRTCGNITGTANITLTDVPDYELLPTNDKLIENHSIIESAINCPLKNCNSKNSVIRTLTKIGDIIIFEVTNANDSSELVSLAKIPKKLFNPLTNTRNMFLVGVCSYKVRVNLRKNPQQALMDHTDVAGHYTALTYRWASNNWCEIDDLEKKSIHRKDSYRVVPRLLMYCLNEK